MLGDLFNNNKRKDVKVKEDELFYKGIKYAKEKRTGYYMATTGKRRRLHDVMYEEEVLDGEAIPPGYVIHHIDWDKSHNEINNLAMVTVKEHNLIHNSPKLITKEDKELIEDLDKRGLIKYNKNNVFHNKK